jgi:hypothetical protein
VSPQRLLFAVRRWVDRRIPMVVGDLQTWHIGGNILIHTDSGPVRMVVDGVGHEYHRTLIAQGSEAVQFRPLTRCEMSDPEATVIPFRVGSDGVA